MLLLPASWRLPGLSWTFIKKRLQWSANANWRKFIDTGYNRFLDFGGYNRKTHCAHSGYNRWL